MDEVTRDNIIRISRKNVFHRVKTENWLKDVTVTKQLLYSIYSVRVVYLFVV